MDHKSLIQSATPHIIALLIFVVIACVYFIPVLQGKKLPQHDIIQGQGMVKEVKDHREATGEEALWTNSMFGGMPAYHISMKTEGNLIQDFNKLISLGLPHPVRLLFLSLVGFYLLLIVMKANPWLSIVGAIAFAFCSYFFIILWAGHNTKAHSMCYMAPIVAGFYLLMNRKYLGGGILLALSLALNISANHIQITYYIALISGLYVLIETVLQIRQQDWGHLVKVAGVAVVAILLAVGSNATRLWTTYEYAKETIRGGKSELTVKKAETDGGLDKEYAYRWSYGKAESFTLLIPDFYGGASQGELTTKSEYYKTLTKKGVPAGQARRYIEQVPLYWGEQPSTSGPVYIGAIVCFLFVFAAMLIRGPIMWWLVSATIVSLLLAWGKHFDLVIDLFFDYFPLFNKFRAPSMMLVITQFCAVLFAFLGLKELFNPNQTKESLMKALKVATISTGGFCLLFIVGASMFFDFEGKFDGQLPVWLQPAIKADRASIMRMDALRSLVFIILAAALIWAYIQEKIKMAILMGGLGILTIVDQGGVAKRYLNNDKFITEKKYSQYFNPSPVDRQILQDTDPNYRVFNLTSNTFNDAMTSYHHKSVGGYHAAKLIRYQDLIEHQISKNNTAVLNMLNTRYLIVPDKDKNPAVRQNPGALGNAWFVKEINWVADADAEVAALDNFEPAQTVVVDKRYEEALRSFAIQYDPEATIKLVNYLPNHLTYETNASGNQLAVFSEIYYNQGKGWQAYLDGKPVEHQRGNYVLRIMAVPAGKHTLEFKFEPRAFYLGEKISLASSGLLLLTLVGFIIMGLRKGFKGGSPTEDQAAA